MEVNELKTLLSTLGYPVAYDHFKEKTTPTFILFNELDSTAFKADDYTYFLDHNYIVDLVTLKKEPLTEKSLEELFDENFIPFDKTEAFISDEQIYQIRYTI